MNKRLFNDIEGKSIFLKPLSIDDVIEIHKFASDEKVSKFIGWNLTYNTEETLKIIKDMIKKEREGTGIYASIVLKSTGNVIGVCMFFNFDLEEKHAEIGYVLSGDHWNRGYGTEVIRIMNDYAHQNLQLNRLYARVVDVNIGSSRILEKGGFLLEEQVDDYYCIDGEYYGGLFFCKILD